MELRHRRAIRRWAGLATIVVAAGVLLTPAVNRVTPPPDDRSTAAVSDHGTWVRLRHEFGFRSDPGYLASVAAAPDTTDVDLGVPLLPTEQQEMVRRFSLGAVVGRITRLASTSPFFGGIRVDQASGGVLEVGIVHRRSPGAAALVAKIRALVPAADPLRLVDRAYPWSALVAANDRVVAALASGELARLGVVSAGLLWSGEVLTVKADAPLGAEAAVRRAFPEGCVVVQRLRADRPALLS